MLWCTPLVSLSHSSSVLPSSSWYIDFFPASNRCWRWLWQTPSRTQTQKQQLTLRFPTTKTPQGNPKPRRSLTHCLPFPFKPEQAQKTQSGNCKHPCHRSSRIFQHPACCYGNHQIFYSFYDICEISPIYPRRIKWKKCGWLTQVEWGRRSSRKMLLVGWTSFSWGGLS